MKKTINPLAPSEALLELCNEGCPTRDLVSLVTISRNSKSLGTNGFYNFLDRAFYLFCIEHGCSKKLAKLVSN